MLSVYFQRIWNKIQVKKKFEREILKTFKFEIQMFSSGHGEALLGYFDGEVQRNYYTLNLGFWGSMELLKMEIHEKSTAAQVKNRITALKKLWPNSLSKKIS